MAGWGALVQPVLLFMVSVENSMLAVGSQIWNQTKGNINSLYSSATGNIKSFYSGAQNLASNSYEDVRRRAGSIYEDLHVKAEAKSKSIVEQVGNQIHLVYINAHLKFNLALNKLQLNFGILIKDIKSRFREFFRFNLGLKFKNLQEKANVKVTKLKNKTSEKVKDRFQNISLKAREYEDVLEEKLTLLSGSPVPRPLHEGRLTLRRNIPSPSTTPSPSEIDSEFHKVKIVTNSPEGLFSYTSNVSGSSTFGSSPSTFSSHTINNNSYRKSQILLRPNKHKVKTRSPSLPDILEPPGSEIQICSNCFADDISGNGNIDKSKRIHINSNKVNSPEMHNCMWKSFSFVGPNPPDKFDCVSQIKELDTCTSNEELLHPKNLLNKSISNPFHFDDKYSDSTISSDINTQNQQDSLISPNIKSSHSNGIRADLSEELMEMIDSLGEDIGNIKFTKIDNIETDRDLNSLSDSWKGHNEKVNISQIMQDLDDVLDDLSNINTNTNTVAEYSPNSNSYENDTEDIQENRNSIENNISQYRHSDKYPVIRDLLPERLPPKTVKNELLVSEPAHNEIFPTHLNHPESEEDNTASLQLGNCKEDDTEVNVQSTQLNTSSSTVCSHNPSQVEDNTASLQLGNCKEDDIEVNVRSTQLNTSSSTVCSHNPCQVDNLQTLDSTNDLSLSLGHYFVVIVTVYCLLYVIF